MQEVVKRELFSIYSSLKMKTPQTAVKYYYLYNDVNVNLYFDAYDNDNPLFSIVLSYNSDYYYTPLSIITNERRKEYLTDIPSGILERILDESIKLDDFFNSIDEHIVNGKHWIIGYKDDKIFTNTLKYSSHMEDLPFLWTSRRARMTDDTLERLVEKLSIPRDVLKAIQSNGRTLVRTSDASKRKNLRLILNDVGIRIDL